MEMFDQIGKCHAIIPAPQRASLSNVEFGGPNFDELYVTNGDKVFKRRTTVKRCCILAGTNQVAAPLGSEGALGSAHGHETPTQTCRGGADLISDHLLSSWRI
jgi:hypothetical protein